MKQANDNNPKLIRVNTSNLPAVTVTDNKKPQLEIVVSTETDKQPAKHLFPYLGHEDRKTLHSVMNSEDLEKGRLNFGGKDELLAVFVNTFKLKRSESKTVKGEYIKHTRNQYEDHKNDENYFNTGKKDNEGNEIWELKHKTVTGWRQHKVNKVVHELPTAIFYAYPINADVSKLNKVIGAAVTALKEDQYLRADEGRPTLRKSGEMHFQLFLNGKMILNTQNHIFEGMPSRLLFADFSTFAKQMFKRATIAAEKKTDTVKQLDAVVATAIETAVNEMKK